MGDGRFRPVGLNGILKEKLDVTLERPDVTLYDLIELLFVQFCLVFLGCVCQNVCCCIFAFIFEDRVLLLSVCQPTQSAILSPLHLCFNPLPPPTSVLQFSRGHCLPKLSFMLRKWTKPTNTRRNTTPASSLKSPYLLPTLQETEASHTSQMI